MKGDTDRDLGTSHLAPCSRCGTRVQSYMLVRGMCGNCSFDTLAHGDDQSHRTRAATEAACPEFVETACLVCGHPMARTDRSKAVCNICADKDMNSPKCEICGIEIADGLMIQGAPSPWCVTCAEKVGTGELSGALQEVAPRYTRAQHEAVAQKLVADALAKPNRTDAPRGMEAPTFDGDGLRFTPSQIEAFMVFDDGRHVGEISLLGNFFIGNFAISPAQLRRIADVCERVKGRGQ